MSVPPAAASGRRWRAVVALSAAVAVLAGCTGSSSGSTAGSSAGAGQSSAAGPGPSAETGPLVVGGADFTEMRIMQAMYGQLLTRAGFDITYRTSVDRTAYTRELEAGTVDVVPDYAATMAEFLNREVNGPGATAVAGSDPVPTVTALRRLAEERGLAVLAPAKAANQNGFAVTSAFARKLKITSLSQLAATNAPIVLAATAECARRPFCQVGLERIYGLKVSSVLPLGFGSVAAKQAVIDKKAGMVLVGTTDGTLKQQGLQLLADDKKLQPADNLIPVVNAASAGGPTVAAALDPLAAVLTTADLAELNEQVDGERRTPEGVAADYLTARKLLPTP